MVRRKGAVPEVDPAIAYAIAQAVEAQDIEGVRKIVLAHEAQMHSLRIILFDFLIIFRDEHYKANDVVSKRRFAGHIARVRKTLEQNVPDFRAHHGDPSETADLDGAMSEENLEFLEDETGRDIDVAALVRQAADDARDREGESEEFPVGVDQDLMDEMLERASEETDTPSLYDANARRPHPTTSARTPSRRRRR